jgi:integrase
MPKTSSRGTYARERVHLTADTIRKARSMIAAGRFEGRGHEFLDTSCQGLTLRVTKASGTWYLRTRATTVRLGLMEDLPVAAAREAALRALVDLKAGRKTDPLDLHVFADVMKRTGDLEVAIDAGFPEVVKEQSDEDRRRRGPWQWRDLVDEFLAEKVKGLKEGYGPKYAAYHRGPEFDDIWHAYVRDIELSDLESLRDGVVATRTVSAAARVVRQNREMLSWAWRYHGTRSGLGEVQHPWWDRWAIQYQSGTREHTPTATELVRTLLVAEHYLALGGTTQETGPGMLAALWAIVLTGQRTGPLMRTRRDAIIPMPGRPGWEVLTWTGAMMKGGKNAGRPHALPIPPGAIEAIARQGAPTDGDWLFPSRVDGKPVSPTGLNQFFYRLRGRMKPGKGAGVTKRDNGDLFKAYGIRVWTPHDARRSLATFLDDEELGGAASAILAHSRGKASEEAKVEDITRRVYAKAQRLDLKAKGMEAWASHVIAAYERERARFKPIE